MKPTLAELLEHHFRRVGLPVSRISSQAQIPKQTLFNWRDGRRPRWHPALPADLARLARALGLDSEESDALLMAAGCVCAVTTPRFEDEEMNALRLPRAWIRAGSHPDEYDMGVDTDVRCGDLAAAGLRSRSASPSGFGTLMQMCAAGDRRGERVRFSARVRTRDVQEWCGLWLRIDGEDSGEILGFDNMENRPLTGTSDWTQHSVVLNVPRESAALAYGVLLCGTGQVWIADVRVERVGEDVPTTDMASCAAPEPRPTNLDFSA